MNSCEIDGQKTKGQITYFPLPTFGFVYQPTDQIVLEKCVSVHCKNKHKLEYETDWFVWPIFAVLPFLVQFFLKQGTSVRYCLVDLFWDLGQQPTHKAS